MDMKILLGKRASTLLALIMGMVIAGPGYGSALGAPPSPGAAEPSLVETPQPALIKLLPPRIAHSKTLTVAVAVGSPPDDFRNDKGKIVGWEIDILRSAAQS